MFSFTSIQTNMSDFEFILTVSDCVEMITNVKFVLLLYFRSIDPNFFSIFIG